MMLALALLASQPAAIDYGRLLVCIEMIESGSTPDPWGRRGGGLQWTEAAWKEETKLPFTLAMHKPTSYIYARRRLAKFAVRLINAGIEPNAYNLGMGWKHGFDGALQRLKLLTADDYGTRCQNLYDDS